MTWDEALEIVTTKMREALDRFGAESVLPYYYGGSNGLLTNDLEDARFFRRLGASRLARTLCAAPTGAAATAMYGQMPGVAYEDYEAARLIVVWGCNPSASGIHLVSHIKAAQKAGARLVVVDPRRTPLARQADLHLPVRPGTDLPVALRSSASCSSAAGPISDFLAHHATGADELRRKAAEWTLERAAAESGVDADSLARFAEWYGTTSPAVIRCGWGQERNRNGGASTMADPGAAGRRWKVRRARRRLHDEQLGGLGHPGRTADRHAEAPATRVVNMNRWAARSRSYRIRPSRCCSSTTAIRSRRFPTRIACAAASQREDLFTVVHEQVMTDTAEYADVVLPATTFLEHYDIAKGYGAYHLQLVQPVIGAVGESRPNHEVFRELGVRLGVTPASDDDLGETGALLDAASRLPGGVRPAILEGAALVTPGDGRPMLFGNVMPQNRGRARAPLPVRGGHRQTASTLTRQTRRRAVTR